MKTLPKYQLVKKSNIPQQQQLARWNPQQQNREAEAALRDVDTIAAAKEKTKAVAAKASDDTRAEGSRGLGRHKTKRGEGRYATSSRDRAKENDKR